MEISKIRRIEKHLSDIYTAVQSKQGPLTKFGTVEHSISALKSLIRGGAKYPFCIIKGNPNDPNDLSGVVQQTNPVGFSVKINATYARFKNRVVQIQQNNNFSIGNQDVNNNSLVDSKDSFYCILTVADTSSSNNDLSGEFRVRKGAISRQALPQIPSVPENEVPFCLIKVNSTGITDNDIDNTYFDKFGSLADPLDDHLMDVVFPAVVSDEISLSGKSRASEISNTVRALNSYFERKYGASFKNYWKTRGVEFSDEFCNLFSHVLNDELVRDFCGHIEPNNFYDNNKTLLKESGFEAHITCSGGSAPTTLVAYGARKTFTRVLYKLQSGTTLYLEDTSSFPNSGSIIVVSENGRIPYGYTSKDDNNKTIQLASTPSNAILPWVTVYLADAININIPGGAQSRVESLGASGAKYLFFVTKGVFDTKGHESVQIRIKNT